MKTPRLLLSSMIAASTLVGCVNGPALQTPITQISGKHLRIDGAHAYPRKQGILILGHVRRAPLDLVPIWGHLHVTAWFADDRTPLVVDTRLGTLSPRGVRSASFAALLRTPDPTQVVSVRVEYRPEADDRNV